MADQNVNININEFDRPAGNTQTFGPDGSPAPGGSGNSPNPNAHAPRTQPPAAPEPPESPNSVTGQIVNQAVVPIMETIFGRNPVTGAASSLASLLGGGAGGGGGGSLTGGAAGAAGAGALGTALAVTGAVGAIGALTAAFFYAKDQFLSAADEVAQYNGKIAQAKAVQGVQALYDRVNRANELQDEFSTMINLQTDANHLWSEMNTELMKVFSPAMTELLSQVVEMLQLGHDLSELLGGSEGMLGQILGFLATLTIPGQIKIIRQCLEELLGIERDKKREGEEPFIQMEKILNANLARIRAGQLPQNGGLGG